MTLSFNLGPNITDREAPPMPPVPTPRPTKVAPLTTVQASILAVCVSNLLHPIPGTVLHPLPARSWQQLHYIMMGLMSWNQESSEGWCMNAIPTHKPTHHLERLAKLVKDLLSTWLTRRLNGIDFHSASVIGLSGIIPGIIILFRVKR
mmetsp:Transcript_28036/g.50512  ORF Transcript_28036/g.50512 Transcript_28036/m.50512 type:complete len:148 (-) Transcript_28036:10-453(-)